MEDSTQRQPPHSTEDFCPGAAAKSGDQNAPSPIGAGGDEERVCAELARVSEDLKVTNLRDELLMGAIRKIEHDCEVVRVAAREVAEYRSRLEDAHRRIAVLESALESVLHTMNLQQTRLAAPAPARLENVETKQSARTDPPAAFGQKGTAQVAGATAGNGKDGMSTSPKPAAEAGEERGEILVFDSGKVANDITEQLSAWGQRVANWNLDPDLGIDIAGRVIAAAAVNLATPSSWGVVRRLCSQKGSTTRPVVAYAQTPDGAHAFWLGPVQFAILPLDDSDVVELFRRAAPDARRVLAFSSDFELMQQIRREMERTSISASVVLDYRQTQEMIPIVQPQAALVHLTPGSDAPFRVLTELRSSKLTQTIPVVLVLDSMTKPSDAIFFSTGMARLSVRGSLSTTELARTCARGIAQVASQSPRKADHT